jgi:mannonate dehydratase
VQSAWDGLDAKSVWDCHVHLIGLGDEDKGLWINPNMRSWMHPILRIQFMFYMDGSCIDELKGVDSSYVNRLIALQSGMMPGSKSMLLAFDYLHDEKGRRVAEHSHMYTANEYAEKISRQYPDYFEWVASVHPYRQDCVEALESAKEHGARAVKWLPEAMGIDPASPLCDRFYRAITRLNLPLLTHAGKELAVEGKGIASFGNPLKLRRPLDHGIRVIVGHCASLGECRDLDRGQNGPSIECFDLFTRLMDEPQYQGLLYGDISAVTQVNRVGRPLQVLLQRQDWYPRLINGSDYPLPGILPVISLKQLRREGYIKNSDFGVLNELRRHNPLLFDFVLKRTIELDGNHFSKQVFETRRHFI